MPKTSLDSDHRIKTLYHFNGLQIFKHGIRNDGVGSSNLSCGTNKFKDLSDKRVIENRH